MAGLGTEAGKELRGKVGLSCISDRLTFLFASAASQTRYKRVAEATREMCHWVLGELLG